MALERLTRTVAVPVALASAISVMGEPPLRNSAVSAEVSLSVMVTVAVPVPTVALGAVSYTHLRAHGTKAELVC
ncbi:MAG: hypothetical protein MPK62_15065, partial [Alphaproteobacteria bacterium]|nr:hypothetical protein [Alphaproteobacteria bacterium]